MMKSFITRAKNTAVALIANKSASSLWEYLLVITIVCIIGAALIGIITGSDGVNSLWTGLFNRFKNLLNTGAQT